MSRLWNSLCSLFIRRTEISEGAKNIEQIFHDQQTQQPFFNLVRATFEQYDQWNKTHGKNDHFSEDIGFIIDCMMATFSSSDHMELFPQRIDAYFYILCRINEYINLSRGSPHRMTELRKLLFARLGEIFRSSRGSYPTLYATDRDVISRMDFRKYLMFLTNIEDVSTLLIFFALCKLVFQSSFALDEHGCLHWIEILSKVREWKVSLQDFAQQYVECIEAFEPFPLNMVAFIHVIQKINVPMQKESPPFEMYRALLSQLKLDEKEFFSQYQALFENGLRNKPFHFLHVGSLLIMLHPYDDLFGRYLQKWAYSVSSKELWNMFLYLSKTQVFAARTVDHILSTLTIRTEKESFEMVKHCCVLVKSCSKQMKDENRTQCLRIFETVFSSSLAKQMSDTQYTCRLNEDLLGELLTSAIELSVSPGLQNPSCLLIIRHLLFEMDNDVRNKFEKLNRLFRRMNKFDQHFNCHHDSINIIQDEWLNDHWYRIPQDWFTLRIDEYRRLCDLHRNNPWSLHIWSRILHLSFSRVTTADTNEVLLELDRWMIKVEHKNYDSKDPLTIILVSKIFEVLLYKQMKSALNLPNIPTIINYIICTRNMQPHHIDLIKVDEFILTVKQSIQSVLFLNGKLFVVVVTNVFERHCYLF